MPVFCLILMSYVRIQGGTLQRQKIQFESNHLIRPTTAIVRDVLFNWLGNDLRGCYCLDLFAGSGILGWEALSRGAERIYLIEKSRRVCSNLYRQLKALEDGQKSLEDRTAICCADVFKWLKKAQGHHKMDVIFIDPPYSLDYLTRSLELLYMSKDLPEPLIDEDTLIYYETHTQKAEKIGQGQFVFHKESKRGQTYFGLLKLTS